MIVSTEAQCLSALGSVVSMLQHAIDFTDEGTPTCKDKPAGVMGAEPIRAVPACPLRRAAASRVKKRFALLGPTPPVDPRELTFLALDTAAAASRQQLRSNPRVSLAPSSQGLAVDTRTPYTREYLGSEGGKMAHYMLRWVNTRDETGPWSETATATIGA